MTTSLQSPPTPAQRFLVILGAAAYLATGFIYLTSGLVVPGGWLIALWLVWLLGAWSTAVQVARWSWWTLAAAPLALLFWWLYLTVGEALLGWTP